MYNHNYNQSIYHHGIKGQKWGVRRFQKKDGTLTPAGKKRYSDSENTTENLSKYIDKSKHRLRLEKQYKEKGLSNEEAELRADRRIKVEKVLAVTAGVTVAAATAYYLKNKWTETYCDQILKAGTQFHNLDSISNERPGEHLYVNYRQNDTYFFRGQFALGKLKKSGHVFNHVVEAKEDIKIPSLNTRKSVFKQLYNNDPDFKKVFQEHSKSFLGPDLTNASSNKVYKQMWSKFGDKDDPNFNIAKRKYFEALRQKGYEAIVDEWDTKASVYRSDAPLILLNTSSKSLGSMTIKELTDKEILVSQANSRKYNLKNFTLNSFLLPHTNHFKESDKHLSKYAKLNDANTKHIDKAISEMKRLGYSDNDIRKRTLDLGGGRLADIGKYMTKDKDMTFWEAQTKAAKKELEIALTELGITSAALSTPIITLLTTRQNSQVEKYIRDHPYTKKTVTEIRKMYS